MSFLKGILKANQINKDDEILDYDELFALGASISNNPEEIESFIFKIRSQEKKDEGPKANRFS